MKPIETTLRSLKPIALAGALLTSACLTSYVGPPPGPKKPSSAVAPTEMDPAAVAGVGVLLGCAPDSQEFFCRATAAFAVGVKPSGHSIPTAMAGVSALVPLPDSPNAGPVAYETSYLVLADDGVRYGTVLPSNDEERASAKALFLAVTGGEPVPVENPSAQFARSRKGTNPAQATQRSLTWSSPTMGYARQTPMGIVVIEAAPGGIFAIGVFPPQ